jgi:chromate transporter
MGKETFADWRTIVIATCGFIATYYFKKLNTAFIILGGALLGFILSLL